MKNNKLLACPYIVWMILFTIIPLGIVFYYALTDSITGQFTLANLAGMGTYLPIFLRSIWLSLFASLICLVIGYPVAYFIAQCKPLTQRFLEMLIMLPMCMSFLLRTRSGEFTIGSTYSIAELRQMKEKGRLGDAVISIEDSLNGLIDKLSLTGLDEKQARLIRNGAEIFPGELKGRDDSRLVMLYADGEFLGIGQTDEGGSVHIKINLTEAGA